MWFTGAVATPTGSLGAPAEQINHLFLNYFIPLVSPFSDCTSAIVIVEDAQEH